MTHYADGQFEKKEEQSVHARVEENREALRAYRAERDALRGGQDASLGPQGGVVERIEAFTDQSGIRPVDPCQVPHEVPPPTAAERGETLPTDAAARKDIPLVTGLLDYFPAALAEVAKVSKAGNDKHNPGEPMHWARGKSMDQADCIGRHLLERGGFDPETGQRHTAQMAWRALALLQLELEGDGAPTARGAR